MRRKLMPFFAVAVLLLTTSCPQPAEVEIPEEAAPEGAQLKFRLPEHNHYPEGIAYDPVSGTFFLSCLRQSRIIRISADGSYDTFVSGPENGLMATLGMKVDAERRILWVCSARTRWLLGGDELPAQTGVFAFSIDDAGLIKSWSIEMQDQFDLFNDVALTRSGDAYATTFSSGRVYKISLESDEPELLIQMDDGMYNNGIALDAAERFLFFASDDTIYRYEFGTQELIELAAPEGERLGYTDGLYFRDGALVAVQSWGEGEEEVARIAQLFLNADFTAVERIEILEQNHPDFAAPTTGAVVGDKLVFIATSYLNMPPSEEREEQHPDILIFEVALQD